MTTNVLAFPGRDTEKVEETYRTLIEGLRRSIFRYGSRRARGLVGVADYRQLVEEVADETFAMALVRWDSYDSARGPVLWWLFMLGRKRMALELRRLERDRQTFEAMTGVLETELLEPTRSRGGREFRQVLERDRLGRALRGLGEEQLQALGLFYLLELSLEEVGRLMGKTPAAVASLLQRARKSARKRLEGGVRGDGPETMGKGEPG